MLEAMPCVPLGGQVRVGLAPDIDVLCTGIETGIAELVKEAAAAGPAPKQPAGRRAAKAGAASRQ